MEAIDTLECLGSGGMGGLAANGGGDVVEADGLFSLSSFATSASLSIVRSAANERTLARSLVASPVSSP